MGRARDGGRRVVIHHYHCATGCVQQRGVTVGASVPAAAIELGHRSSYYFFLHTRSRCQFGDELTLLLRTGVESPSARPGFRGRTPILSTGSPVGRVVENDYLDVPAIAFAVGAHAGRERRLTVTGSYGEAIQSGRGI